MLNDKVAYVDQQDHFDYDEKHETILNYLKKNQINVGRQAKHPIVTSEMRKKSWWNVSQNKRVSLFSFAHELSRFSDMKFLPHYVKIINP